MTLPDPPRGTSTPVPRGARVGAALHACVQLPQILGWHLYPVRSAPDPLPSTSPPVTLAHASVCGSLCVRVWGFFRFWWRNGVV